MQKKENKKYKKKQQRYGKKISTLNINFERIPNRSNLWVMNYGLIEP